MGIGYNVSISMKLEVLGHKRDEGESEAKERSAEAGHQG
jgi:hypothetical protein